MLTTITTVMAFIMIYILWWMVYGLFTAKSKMQVASIAGLIRDHPKVGCHVKV